MKKAVVAYSVIILSLLLISITSAKSEDVFLDHLTDLMWEDCKGKDLHINQNVLFSTVTKEPVTLIKGQNYDKSGLRIIISHLKLLTIKNMCWRNCLISCGLPCITRKGICTFANVQKTLAEPKSLERT